MKQRHLGGDSYPLTLNEVLEECSSTNLVSESLDFQAEKSEKNSRKFG
jgi:hypothetical protein